MAGTRNTVDSPSNTTSPFPCSPKADRIRADLASANVLGGDISAVIDALAIDDTLAALFDHAELLMLARTSDGVSASAVRMAIVNVLEVIDDLKDDWACIKSIAKAGEDAR